MTRQLTMLLTLAAGLAAPPAAGDAGAQGDPKAGEAAARQVCVMCHKLPDGSGTAVAPGLAELAAKETLNVRRLQEILNQPQHAPANAQTNAAQLDDLAAYLQSLE
jgi:mono/diheme cytochrome c family protein